MVDEADHLDLSEVARSPSRLRLARHPLVNGGPMPKSLPGKPVKPTKAAYLEPVSFSPWDPYRMLRSLGRQAGDGQDGTVSPSPRPARGHDSWDLPSLSADRQIEMGCGHRPRYTGRPGDVPVRIESRPLRRDRWFSSGWVDSRTVWRIGLIRSGSEPAQA